MISEGTHTNTQMYFNLLTRNNFTSIKLKYDTQTLTTSGHGHKTSECINGTLMNLLCGFKSIEGFLEKKKREFLLFGGGSYREFF